jgi:hypothetical protein
MRAACLSRPRCRRGAPTSGAARCPPAGAKQRAAFQAGGRSRESARGAPRQRQGIHPFSRPRALHPAGDTPRATVPSHLQAAWPFSCARSLRAVFVISEAFLPPGGAMVQHPAARLTAVDARRRHPSGSAFAVRLIPVSVMPDSSRLQPYRAAAASGRGGGGKRSHRSITVVINSRHLPSTHTSFFISWIGDILQRRRGPNQHFRTT